MKALSLLQPWATLIAISAKRIETRSWYTNHRGPIAIHASKRIPPEVREWMDEDDELAADLADHGVSLDDLPLGCVVATATLASCIRFDPGAATRIINVGTFPEHETAYGDFSPGRYGWMLENVVRLPEPIPAKGSLGLWEWEGGAA